MKIKETELIAYGFIAIGIVTIIAQIIVAAADIVEAHKTAGDLATWIGAFGTVGALAGAIFLSSRDYRSRKNDEKNRARLAAASLALRIRLTKGIILNVADILERLPEDEKQDFELRKCKMILSNLHIWTTDELMPLTFVAPMLAASLSAAGAQIGAGLRGVHTLVDMIGANRIQLQKLGTGMLEPWTITIKNLDGLAEHCEAVATDWD